MYVLAFGPLPVTSQNDDASTGLVTGLKLTKMRVRTFWTAPNPSYHKGSGVPHYLCPLKLYLLKLN